jgi:hypothetical protein
VAVGSKRSSRLMKELLLRVLSYVVNYRNGIGDVLKQISVPAATTDTAKSETVERCLCTLSRLCDPAVH